MGELGNKAVMANNIEKYMALHGETRKDICAVLGVPYTTVTNWVKGNTYPRIDKIELLASRWGIQKSDLVEQKEEPTPVTESGPLNEFQDLMSQLTPDEQRLIVSQIKGILSNRE